MTHPGRARWTWKKIALPARLDEVADWTSERGTPAGQQTLETTEAAPPRRGRRPAAGPGGQVVATSSLVLWQVLVDAYRGWGSTRGRRGVPALVLARIVEPTSKADTLRVLAELGVPCPRVRTLYRSLKRCEDTRLPRPAGHGVLRALVASGGCAPW